jgi:glycosyltransferase involved in cell wall biosynthesis
LDLFRLFRRLRPDLVHLVTPKPVLYGGIAARFAGIDAVVAAVSGLGHVFSSDGGVAHLARPIVTTLYRFALEREHVRVIFQNPDDRAMFVRIGAVTQERAVTIRGSGVDLAAFRPAPEPGGTPVVTFAARLLKPKGVHEFVEAARRLRARGVAARFLLAGEIDPDNPTSVTREEIEQWRVGGLIEVLGQRRDIANVFAASSLVVLPSYYAEGLPKVLVDAAACGRPIITTDWPGCRDAIEPGVTGLLVPPRDPGALADAIADLLADRARRQRMGVAARALAEREYSIHGITGAHLNVYAELLDGAR